LVCLPCLIYSMSLSPNRIVVDAACTNSVRLESQEKIQLRVLHGLG
jgi:hypothetical protein